VGTNQGYKGKLICEKYIFLIFIDLLEISASNSSTQAKEKNLLGR